MSFLTTFFAFQEGLPFTVAFVLFVVICLQYSDQPIKLMWIEEEGACPEPLQENLLRFWKIIVEAPIEHIIQNLMTANWFINLTTFIYRLGDGIFGFVNLLSGLGQSYRLSAISSDAEDDGIQLACSICGLDHGAAAEVSDVDDATAEPEDDEADEWETDEEGDDEESQGHSDEGDSTAEFEDHEADEWESDDEADSDTDDSLHEGPVDGENEPDSDDEAEFNTDDSLDEAPGDGEDEPESDDEADSNTDDSQDETPDDEEDEPESDDEADSNTDDSLDKARVDGEDEPESDDEAEFNTDDSQDEILDDEEPEQEGDEEVASEESEDPVDQQPSAVEGEESKSDDRAASEEYEDTVDPQPNTVEDDHYHAAFLLSTSREYYNATMKAHQARLNDATRRHKLKMQQYEFFPGALEHELEGEDLTFNVLDLIDEDVYIVIRNLIAIVGEKKRDVEKAMERMKEVERRAEILKRMGRVVCRHDPIREPRPVAEEEGQPAAAPTRTGLLSVLFRRESQQKAAAAHAIQNSAADDAKEEHDRIFKMDEDHAAERTASLSSSLGYVMVDFDNDGELCLA